MHQMSLSIEQHSIYRACMEKLGEIIRSRRSQRFPNARSFADAIGKDPAWVSKLENGLLKETPSPTDLVAIERETGIAQADVLRAWGYIIDSGGDSATPRFSHGDIRQLVVERLGGLSDREVGAILALTDYMAEHRQ